MPKMKTLLHIECGNQKINGERLQSYEAHFKVLGEKKSNLDVLAPKKLFNLQLQTFWCRNGSDFF